MLLTAFNFTRLNLWVFARYDWDLSPTGGAKAPFHTLTVTSWWCDINSTVNHEVGVENMTSINIISKILYVCFPIICVQGKKMSNLKCWTLPHSASLFTVWWIQSSKIHHILKEYVIQVSNLSFPWGWQLSQDVQADAGFLCSTTAIRRDTMKRIIWIVEYELTFSNL